MEYDEIYWMRRSLVLWIAGCIPLVTLLLQILLVSIIPTEEALRHTLESFGVAVMVIVTVMVLEGD